MAPGSQEVPPVDAGQGNQFSPETPAKLPICNLVAFIAFWLTLLCLGLAVVLGVLALRLLGLWQLGGRVNPTAETLAMLVTISLFVAMACNAVAFSASLWAWAKAKRKSVVILWFSGIGVLASVACGLSMIY